MISFEIVSSLTALEQEMGELKKCDLVIAKDYSLVYCLANSRTRDFSQNVFRLLFVRKTCRKAQEILQKDRYKKQSS